MTIDEIELIKSNAQTAVNLFVRFEKVTLSYDEASVERVDNFIGRSRDVYDSSTVDRMVSVFGSFLGECVREKYGGQWDKIDGEWGVRFAEGNAAIPFHKVRKQFENGSEDSILSFYQIIPIVFKLNA